MKATEQLSSMEMIGVDPLKRVISPRLWAGIVQFTDVVCDLCCDWYHGR